MIKKKIFRNGVYWGTAKFNTEKEYTDAVYENFKTDWLITSIDTEEDLPEGLIRRKDTDIEDLEDWEEDERSYREAMEMTEDLQKALFRSNSNFE